MNRQLCAVFVIVLMLGCGNDQPQGETSTPDTGIQGKDVGHPTDGSIGDDGKRCP